MILIPQTSVRQPTYNCRDLTKVASTDAAGETLLSTHNPAATELPLSGRIPT